MKAKQIIVILVIAILAGCSGQHCIKLGGSYQGVEGNLQYCFDSEKSKDAGKPVLVDKTDPTNEAKQLIALTGKDIADINTMLDKADKVKAASTKTGKAGIKELLHRLEVHRLEVKK